MWNIGKNIIRYLFAKYLAFKSKSFIRTGAILNPYTNLEGSNVIHKKVNISNSRIGYGTYIGERTILNNTLIGRYCSIAEGVKIISGQHPTKMFVSTHPAFFSTARQAGFTYVSENKFPEFKHSSKDNSYTVTIGNDVWIGADVKILEGINIEDGVIIATGAVVVKDLEAYTIYGGVPAKKIGQRFSEKEKKFLLENKWWENDEDWIKQNVGLFSDINQFITQESKKK
ncbi:CatB-related O-acetyltransferase [Bacillus sp. DNRA2]|uniref:CatB-related O-acetyltransferase n=1 Tax=Bacillus sp. DNRA2 TaxID=2723053 RepID=UPI00145DADCD|nr:CatB-related O-acetyltransferase [Bacillus sp. DNRA2]NMD70180.1 CatB-related O-acetyltransferase [Bacillus sp. DNRA2]